MQKKLIIYPKCHYNELGHFDILANSCLLGRTFAITHSTCHSHHRSSYKKTTFKRQIEK